MGLEIERGPTAIEIFESPEVLVQQETSPLAERVGLLAEEVRELKQRVQALEDFLCTD